MSKTARDAEYLSKLLYCLLFLSGASALIYEVAWVRMLGLAVGSTTQAASCVIAAFLGGLALGSWIAGKIADRIAIPHLVLYGMLEVSVGIAGPAVSYLLSQAPGIFVSLSHDLPIGNGGLTAARLLLSSLSLLPPTILMGATLPVVTSLLAKNFARPAHFFSMLYGLNTLGAAVGSLSAVYLCFPFLGVTGTIMLAAGINCSVGLVALLMSRRKMALAPAGPAETKATDAAGAVDATNATNAADTTDAADTTNAADVTDTTNAADVTDTTNGKISAANVPYKWLCLIAALMGVTALSYEVLWIRLLRAFIGSSTYAFTSMVSTFLLGLVVGSIIYNRTLRRNPSFCTDLNAQLKMLAVSQYGAAISSIVGLLILPGLVILRIVIGFAINDQREWLFVDFFTSLCLLGLPASFVGLTFPLIGGLAATNTSNVARAIGSVYAANTVGCIIGSLLCGLVLIPTIGSQYAMEIVATLTAITAVVIDLRTGGKLGQIRIGIIVGFLSLVVIFTPAHYLEKTTVYLTFGKLLRASEDAIGRVTFVQYESGKRLVVNGTFYSADQMQSLRYMRALGHLPVLLHKNPHQALVICFGIGTTAGAVAKHDEISHLDICEISPAVLDGAGLFVRTNDDVVHQPKVECLLEDGRNYLLRTNKKYDVISFEPPPPCDAGVVNLYSKEFYELCKKRLNPGGIVCQWAPMHNESATLWKMMVKTMTEVFPSVTVWAPSSSEAIMIASDQPIDIDAQALDRRIASNAKVKASLEQVGLGDAYSIASTYLIGGQKLNSFLSGLSAVTDDHPTLEFFLPYPGETIYAKDIEPYASDVHDIFGLVNGQRQKIDEEKLSKNREAMMELRKASFYTYKDQKAEALEHLKKANAMVPANRYFEWVVKNPGLK